MRRTQVQFDEETYAALKRAAFVRGVSMSALLREIVRAKLNPERPRPQRMEDFHFIAVGSSPEDEGTMAPISERHDEALAEDTPA